MTHDSQPNKTTNPLTNAIKAAARTLRQWAIYATVPVTNAFAYAKQAISNTPSHHHKIPGKFYSANPEIDLTEKKASRTIYMTDWDETILNSGRFQLSGLQRVANKLIAKPTNKPVKTFDRAVDFIESLNDKGIKTAIVSNKDHHKLIKQSPFLGIDDKFDVVMGHDRANRISMRKGWNGKHLLEFTLKKLGIDVHKNMEPVNVVFVGDTPRDDMRSAHELRKHLKALNPQSNVTSVLYNSRNLSPEQIAALPDQKKPDHVVANYQELDQVVSPLVEPKMHQQSQTIRQKEQTIAQSLTPVERPTASFVQAIRHNSNGQSNAVGRM
ncbi:MAG: HAD hydrolase-like protein [Rickettsiales bacterium]|nr:HAD hydrolase-like protein [Rickettsiales bacterium]